MMRYLWSLLLALGVTGCATQSATVSGKWKTITYDKTLSTNVVKEGGMTPDVRLRRIILGLEPALVFDCTARVNAKIVREFESKVVRSRKRARATLVIPNAGNRNLLAYGAGWVVLAPVWLPTYYHVKARGEAKLALSDSPGRRIKTIDKQSCVTETWYDNRGVDASPKRLTEERKIPSVSEPLANVEVTVTAGSRRWKGKTNSNGVLLVPLRSLVSGFAESTALTCTMGNKTWDLEWTTCGLERVVPQLLAHVSEGRYPLGPNSTANLKRQVPFQVAVPLTEDVDMIQAAVDTGNWSAVREKTAEAITRTPDNVALWRLFALGCKMDGKADSALVALSVACALTEPDTDDGMLLRMTFGLWAADRKVEILYPKNEAGRAELTLAHSYLQKFPSETFAKLHSRYKNLAVRWDLFGNLMLSQSVFLHDLGTSDIHDGPDGSPRFWRFIK